MSKKIKMTFMSLFALTAMILAFAFSKAPDAEAAAAVVQTGAAAKSITFRWNAPTKSSDMTSFSITNYMIGYGADYDTAYENAKKGTRTVSGSTLSYTISNLTQGRKYYVYVMYKYNYTRNGYSYTDRTGGVGYAICKTMPTKVIGLSQSDPFITYSTYLEMDWVRQKNVDGYQYLVYNNAGSLVLNTTSTSPSGSYKVGQQGVQYKAHVRGFVNVEGKKVYGPWSDWVYFVPQPDVEKCYVTDAKNLYIKWDKVYSATRYEVYISTTGVRTGYKKVATYKGADKVSTAISSFNGAKFDKQKTYYVYIKAIRVVGDKTYSNTMGRVYYNND